jgi:hypothetical protein
MRARTRTTRTTARCLPPTEPLEFIATPAAIETPENTPQIVEVTIDNPDLGRTHTFVITTMPANGSAEIDNNGRLLCSKRSAREG